MTTAATKQTVEPVAAATNGAEPEVLVFPVTTLREALPELRRPFAPGAVGFKPQHEGESSTLCVAYIDARCVIERLNLVVGEAWTAERRKADDLGSNLMWCDLTVAGVTRSDVGEGQGKALVSDALKRAAVHFGIGRSLYASPAMFVKTGEMIGTQKGKRRLSDKQLVWLRDQYEKWLRSEGIAAFGEVLSHGDALSGSVGVAVDPEGQAQQPAAEPEPRLLPADKVEALKKLVEEAGLTTYLPAKLRESGVKTVEELTVEQAISVYQWATEQKGGE